MSNLHVVYRVDDPGTRREQWSSYSFPYGIHTVGTTLAEARAEFRSAAAFGLSDFDELTVAEHLERPLVPGAYIRTAVDRRTLDREATERAMRASLQVVDQWRDFQETLPPAATGDAVVIACVPDDRLSWIFEQMSGHDAVGLCTLGPATSAAQLVWWSFVVGELAVTTPAATQPLADAGLFGDSTVSEFMQTTASRTGRQLAAGSPA